MKLALEFGIPVRELLERMDGIEYGKWQAYFRIFPFKDDRDDINAASICASARNATLGRGDRMFRMRDFLIDYLKAGKRQSLKGMMNVCKLFAGVYNKATKGRK